ncbi:hypothetical protein B0H10DRAFT_1962173 [Mycena sp. CBHHK59/15]|nr:hypothetical protein B0H10DRAFT_1962173 [Mycena sp. CBHHK59/15]
MTQMMMMKNIVWLDLQRQKLVRRVTRWIPMLLVQNGFLGQIKRQTCVLDILRHVPWCALSKKQNAAIHWAMLALGLQDLPSDRVMDDIDKYFQKMCGVQSIQYSGKLGHVLLCQ